ncbi:Os04g0565325 [Oryza sativa Japonica Group]|uniref:Os04g0565325 protein n=1 Tax=Oryza sativa subsp. japonica TaxID=39947 RepID=A0A0P0WDG1_ORYSJ|nr:Os04g0565325 [Oryza sativa Japonica Group]
MALRAMDPRRVDTPRPRPSSLPRWPRRQARHGRRRPWHRVPPSTPAPSESSLASSSTASAPPTPLLLHHCAVLSGSRSPHLPRWWVDVAPGGPATTAAQANLLMPASSPSSRRTLPGMLGAFSLSLVIARPNRRHHRPGGPPPPPDCSARGPRPLCFATIPARPSAPPQSSASDRVSGIASLLLVVDAVSSLAAASTMLSLQ